MDGGARLDEGLAEVIRVEELAWKGGRGTAIASQQDTREFYGDVARWAAERGWLRIHMLRLDGDPIAVMPRDRGAPSVLRHQAWL